MFEAGVHFGHKKQYSDARGRDNFFGVRDKIVIINLEKTRTALQNALEFLATEAAKGSTFLFVGTKSQARAQIKKISAELEMPYVVNRWLGGTLTNFETIERNLKKLNQLEEALNDANSPMTKKEKTVLKRTIERARFNLSGMQNLKHLPDVLVIFDAAREALAIKEAEAMDIPVVAIMDTNANPHGVTYPIPANDDIDSSLDLITDIMITTIKDNYRAAPSNEPAPTSATEVQKERVPAGSK